MRIKRVEIENFKGVGKRQTIHLMPITLLFGNNSAGKSTVLQALHYAREILERRNPDPDHTIAGGLIDLGGYKALVHNHELDRAITIKLVLELSEAQGSDRLPLNSGTSLGDAEFVNLNLRYIVGENTDLKDYAVVQEVGVEIEVRWSDLLNGPYVSILGIEMDGIPVAKLKSPPQEGRAFLTDFNFSHPLFQQIDDHNLGLVHTELVGIDEAPDDEDLFDSPLAIEIRELSRDMAKESATSDSQEFRVNVATMRGALPDLGSLLSSELRDPDVKKVELESSTPRVCGLEKLLDELLLGPVRITRDYLNAMTYIGPLREIPSRSFRPRRSPDESRWAQGLAAWDLLYLDSKGDLIDAVNGWLGDEDKLGTAYRLEKIRFREIAIPSRMSALFERGLTEDDIGELQELYSSLESRSEIGLRDFNKGILVAPSDVGVGISQMIPVVVGCVAKSVGFLAIEQPELHIHPGMQVGLGDLFIHSIGFPYSGISTGKSLLVETHSEHIMLRLLRRIRETSAGQLPPGAPVMDVAALSVTYVEGGDEGVRFRQLRIDDKGEFRDQWPHGFFEERAEELF
jgi:AAA ATPase domain